MVYRTAVTAPILGFRRDIDRLFEDAFRTTKSDSWTPSVDLKENADALMIAVDLPGVSPEKVDVSSENGVLTITGEKALEHTEGDEARYFLVERAYGSFRRSFRLPETVDESKIEANFVNGVLRVRVPKAPKAQPKKITIQTA
jgi:HSP20 family protein